MKNICAVFLKQLSDTFRNKPVFIQFILFPVLTVLMENFITLDGMPEHFFVKLFAVMFTGMAPLTTICSVIAEEKEKNTLRALMMANVSPAEYLIGIGTYIFVCSMGGTAVFAFMSEKSGKDLLIFILIMASGIILSELTGAVIGIASNDQMSATAISMPVMIVLSFLPMIAMFNDTIDKLSSVFYSQQISRMINGNATSGSALICAANLVLLIVGFIVFYRRKGLE